MSKPAPPNASPSNNNSGLSEVLSEAIETGFSRVLSQIAAAGGIDGLSTPSSAPAPPDIEPPVAMGGGGASEHGGHGGGEGEGKKEGGGLWNSIRENLWEEKVGIGYPALELARGYASRIQQLNSGQYVSPEERQHSMTETLAPGAGGILGATIGTAIPGVGPVLGGFIGQGAGEIVSATVGAKSERDEATREAAEKLAASLSQAEDAVTRFRTQIEQTGAPVAQLGQGLGILQSIAPGVGSAAIAGAGRMAIAEGENYIEDTKTIGTFLSSNPALHGLTQQFAQEGGELSSKQFNDLSKLALTENNLGAYNAAKQGEEARKYADDPAWKALKKHEDDLEGSWFYKARNAQHNFDANVLPHLFGPLAGNKTIAWEQNHDEITEARKAVEERKKAIDEQDETAKNEAAEDLKIENERGSAVFDAMQSDASTAALEGRFRAEQFHGADAKALKSMLPGIRSALDMGAAADDSIIEQDRELMKKLPTDDPARNAYELDISQKQADKVDRQEIRYGQYAQFVFDAGLKDKTSGFDLANLRAQIEGTSADDILARTRKQSRYLEGVANDPESLLDPSQRDDLRSSAIKSVYEAQQNTFGEHLAHDDNLFGQAAGGVAKARAGGTAEEVYSAQGSELDALAVKIKELTNELHTGGQTVADYAREHKALNETLVQSIQLTAQRRQEKYSTEGGNEADRLTEATAGLSRQVALGGSNAIDYQGVGSVFLDTLDTDSRHLAAVKPGSREALQAGAKLASDQAAYDQFKDNANRYHEDADTSIASTQAGTALRHAEHQFSRAKLAPYSDGPDTNPLTAGNALLGTVDKSIAQAKQQEQGLEDWRSKLEKEGRFDKLALQDYTQQKGRYEDAVETLQDRRAQVLHEKYSALFDAVPESVIGSRGLSAGISVAVNPTAALAARFDTSGNPYLGSYGAAHSPGATGSGAQARGNGAVGDFTTAAGGATQETHKLLRELIVAVKQNSMGRNPGPPTGSPSSASRQQQLANIGGR